MPGGDWVVRVLLKRLMCLMNKHHPRRSTMEWDGVSYVGECRHCAARIRRLSHGNWKNDEGIPPPPISVRPPVSSSEPHSSG